MDIPAWIFSRALTGREHILFLWSKYVWNIKEAIDCF